MHAYPDGHVFYRKLTKRFPRIVRGHALTTWAAAVA